MEDDKQYLLNISKALDEAEREGNVDDSPEGSGFIKISDTLAREISNRIRSIADRM